MLCTCSYVIILILMMKFLSPVSYLLKNGFSCSLNVFCVIMYADYSGACSTLFPNAFSSKLVSTNREPCMSMLSSSSFSVISSSRLLVATKLLWYLVSADWGTLAMKVLAYLSFLFLTFLTWATNALLMERLTPIFIIMWDTCSRIMLTSMALSVSRVSYSR